MLKKIQHFNTLLKYFRYFSEWQDQSSCIFDRHRFICIIVCWNRLEIQITTYLHNCVLKNTLFFNISTHFKNRLSFSMWQDRHSCIFNGHKLIWIIMCWSRLSSNHDLFVCWNLHTIFFNISTNFKNALNISLSDKTNMNIYLMGIGLFA